LSEEVTDLAYESMKDRSVAVWLADGTVVSGTLVGFSPAEVAILLKEGDIVSIDRTKVSSLKGIVGKVTEPQAINAPPKVPTPQLSSGRNEDDERRRRVLFGEAQQIRNEWEGWGRFWSTSYWSGVAGVLAGTLWWSFWSAGIGVADPQLDFLAWSSLLVCGTGCWVAGWLGGDVAETNLDRALEKEQAAMKIAEMMGGAAHDGGSDKYAVATETERDALLEEGVGTARAGTTDRHLF
jgi:small nuclear ribonucleoprotein (snRNP)-like protein